MELFVLTVCSIIIMMLLWARQALTHHRDRLQRYPNGPFPLPIIGNFWTIRRLHANPDKTLLELSQKYGDVCMLWLGTWPIIVICKAKAAHDLLHQRGAVSSSRPEHNNLRPSLAEGRLALTPAGSQLRFLRKVYHTVLGLQQSESSRSIHERESVTFLSQLLDEPTGFLEGSERYALSIIFTATYGVRLLSLKHPVVVELYSIWDQLLRYVQPGTLILPDTFPIILKLPKWMQPWYRLAQKLTTRELKIHQDFINQVKEQCASVSSPDSYGKIVLKMQEAGNIDNKLLLGILAMLIGAGSDTTSTVLQNFFKILAMHPQVALSAQIELDAVVGRERLPNWDDTKDLPYLRALIKEVHRWSPIGSIGVPHGITEDIRYNGKLIPKGTIVMPSLVTLNRDPGRYSNPDAFDPTRFLKDHNDAYASALSADYMLRDHFHYGFGRRLCQGIQLAEDSLFIVISRILWAFDLEQLPHHPLSMSDKIYHFTVRPKPFKMSIVCRDKAARAVIQTEILRRGANIETL